MILSPAIFLDRDGVIIENRAKYVRSWADVDIYPQAIRALARLRLTPYKIIIVTNQSVVGRGIISLNVANEINKRLVAEVERANGRVDAVYMCPHVPEDNCLCRKPRPGLLWQAAEQWNLDLARSFMIGDALSDLLAGQAAGVYQSLLLRTGRGVAQAQLPEASQFNPLHVYDDLATAIDVLF